MITTFNQIYMSLVILSLARLLELPYCFKTGNYYALYYAIINTVYCVTASSIYCVHVLQVYEEYSEGGASMVVIKAVRANGRVCGALVQNWLLSTQT